MRDNTVVFQLNLMSTIVICLTFVLFDFCFCFMHIQGNIVISTHGKIGLKLLTTLTWRQELAPTCVI